jgi:hypothetical protein
MWQLRWQRFCLDGDRGCGAGCWCVCGWWRDSAESDGVSRCWMSRFRRVGCGGRCNGRHLTVCDGGINRDWAYGLEFLSRQSELPVCGSGGKYDRAAKSGKGGPGPSWICRKKLGRARFAARLQRSELQMLAFFAQAAGDSRRSSSLAPRRAYEAGSGTA